ncbi:MAG: cytochrome c biogenesis CcdA family protein [Candidatus Nanopelagicales bacterium]
MSNLLTSGSILTAFLAGGIALFAPCCIVFLAPSYMAVAVKNRRWRLLPLTMIFAAGLASVLLPITLGMSLVSAAIAHYHRELYLAGGLLMLLLAAWSVTGRMWSLPSIIRAPDTRRGDSASFFSLGVFSGVASACCAPVLIGVMTLSALSANPVSGVALGLAYVFGMTFPLFVMALLWDRFDLGSKRILRARPVRIPLPGGRHILTNTINLGVAAALAVMGGFVLYLADSGQMTSGPRSQVMIGNWLGSIFRSINQALAPVPEPVLGLGILAIGGIFAFAMLRDRARDARTPTDAGSESTDAPSSEPHCH